ncbi:MAG: glycosyltransferase, partial [Bacteroidales bacterium]|nr:glycosyltransferase [Bacteroidales bacterium]
MSKVAVVILNWNGEKFLKKYIPALVANTPAGLGGEKVELVVADNGSTDGSIQYLKENYPQIVIIPFKEN